jgi:hypothetical protein
VTDDGDGGAATEVTLSAGSSAGPGRDRLREAARGVLQAHWRGAYTVPNSSVYPFQWLWDSCFHAVVWADLGEPERAVTELAHLFRGQSALGFVPHVDYEHAPVHHAEFWGREGNSSITQPPMFGHALAEMWRAGVDVERLVDPARRGLRFLFDHRPRIDGLVVMCHPWESGGDNSPRWDHWCPDVWDPARWYDVKGQLVASLEMADDGSPLANPDFVVAPAGFNALIAFNAFELADVTDDHELRTAAHALVDALDARWDGQLRTWVDAGSSEASSGRVRTLEALLSVLVSERSDAVAAVFADLLDPAAHGGPCGPTQVHRGEPSYTSRTYWRGPAWPQLTYLCWVAARRHERDADARRLGDMLVEGARRSGWAEYWDADDGTGLGAVPQSWATLAALVP